MKGSAWVDSVKAKILDMGSWSGAYGAEVRFTTAQRPADFGEEAALVVKEIERLDLPDPKIVRMIGFNQEQVEPAALADMLHGYGYCVQVVYAGGAGAPTPASSLLSDKFWLTATLKSPMLLTRANEVWYYPGGDAQIPEIVGLPRSPAPQGLFVNRSGSPERLVAFLKAEFKKGRVWRSL